MNSRKPNPIYGLLHSSLYTGGGGGSLKTKTPPEILRDLPPSVSSVDATLTKN